MAGRGFFLNPPDPRMQHDRSPLRHGADHASEQYRSDGILGQWISRAGCSGGLDPDQGKMLKCGNAADSPLPAPPASAMHDVEALG